MYTTAMIINPLHIASGGGGSDGQIHRA